jgi:hypothetical protein
MSLWNAGSGTTLATVIERTTTNLQLPIANGANPTITLISGILPSGLRLEGTTLVGTPFEVERDKEFVFVLRAVENTVLEDRTFNIIVTGPDSPVWQTAEGTLPVGTNNAYFVLDSALVDFQLLATDSDLPAGDTVEYYIADGEGTLPPGLTMSESGRITGIVEPLLSLELSRGDGGYDTASYAGDLFDFGIRSTNGFSSYYYDTQDYDYSVPTRAPKKLNRYYPFIVTASDGDNIVKRDFIIYLVGDDYLRSDNTIMQAGTGVFTADNTYLRNPVWLTPSDLGFRRANNYVTLYLDVIQNDTLAGDVYYSLEQFNLDGTPSELPPGLELDRQTGEVIGRIPYQPAITEEYNFTIKAERFEGDIGIATIYGTYYEDTLLGNESFKVYNLDTSLADGVDDLNELRGKTVRIANRNYKIVNVDDADSELYDVLYLDQTLAPEISLILSQTGIPGNNYFFVQRLSESQKEKYTARTLKFSDTESYSITDIYPYIEYRAEETVGMNLYVNPDAIAISINEVFDVGEYASHEGSIYRLITGDTIDSVVTNSHTIIAATDGNGATIIDAQGNPVPYFDSAKWTLVDTDIRNLSQTLNKTILKQKLERLFPRSNAYVTNPVVGSVLRNDIWSIRIPATSDSRNKTTYIDTLILNSGGTVKVTEYRDNEDLVKIDASLTRTLELGRNIGIGIFKNDFFAIDIAVAEADEVVDFPFSTKQFSIRIIGEIDSEIEWITPADLGSIQANFISTLSVQATTTVPDTALLYTIKSGNLPNGLRLNLDGQIIGRPRQFADEEGLGLTTFDNQGTGFDGVFPTVTSFDREFKFTVEARDRFGYTAIEREFTLAVDAPDNTQYSNIYVKPFLKPEQRSYYETFVSNPEIFDPAYIYRPDDPEFGIQRQLKMLVYAGIETKEIAEYVAASAKHHKRRKFKLGEIKKAVAKFPGETDTVYEVIYIDVIDPANPKKGESRKVLEQKSGKQITMDSINYAVKDDNTNTANGSAELGVYGRETIKFIIPQNEQIIIGTRSGDEGVDADFNDFVVEVRSGGDVEIVMPIADAEPFRFRPVYANTIKADTNAVKVSQTKDNIKYISNIDNMREQIETVGAKERLYLPLWMRTPQGSTYPQELDYVTAIPICYCKEGTGDDILLNIANSGFDVTNINFDIDRYIIDQTTDNSNEQYILFANYQFNV